VPLHPEAQQFLDTVAQSGAPPLYELTPEQARAIPAAVAQMVGPGPEVATVRDISIPGPAGAIGARVYEPAADLTATIVYYHGGGWVFGTLDDWDAVCRTLAVESGCRVVSVDYRLAPEHRFPAAADDAYAAFVWVAESLAGGKPVVVAGDSAGGNLAAVTALRARDRGGPAIALQVLVYPVTDHDFTRSSYVEHGDSGFLLGTREMQWFWDHYAPDERDRSHPDASPLRATDHSGLPPAYVVIAEYDPLRDEGLAYAERLKAAGVPVTINRYGDQCHVFYTLVNLMESANQAVTETAQEIKKAVGAG
jgi:acetyl esterase/lipase